MYKYEIFITEYNAQKHAWILPPFFIPQYRSRYWPHNPASFRQRVILPERVPHLRPSILVKFMNKVGLHFVQQSQRGTIQLTQLHPSLQRTMILKVLGLVL